MSDLMNYESICAQHGMNLVDLKGISSNEITNLLNKSIGVLQSNGIYAFLIWIDSRLGKGNTGIIAKSIRENVIKLIAKYAGNERLQKAKVDEVKTEEIKAYLDGRNIEEIFMIKGLIQKMLTYGFYRAKGKLDNDTTDKLEGKAQ